MPKWATGSSRRASASRSRSRRSGTTRCAASRRCWRARDDATASDYDAPRRTRVQASFGARFFESELGYLADVVDGPDGDELQTAPEPDLRRVVAVPVARRRASGQCGRRGRAGAADGESGCGSLSPDDPAYRGDYGGDPVRRDGGYHQGPVWTWLLGAYAEAHYRVHGDRAAALASARSQSSTTCATPAWAACPKSSKATRRICRSAAWRRRGASPKPCASGARLRINHELRLS